MLSQSSLLGNLLVDFMRGNPASKYAPYMVASINAAALSEPEPLSVA
jgi:acyl carrier protein phosphodiesterase